jgi:hypothetical protein
MCVCEPHAEHSNSFGTNTKIGGVKHIVNFMNTGIRVVNQTTSFLSTTITIVKQNVNFLNMRIRVLEHTVNILNTHNSALKHAVNFLNTLCFMIHCQPPEQCMRLDGQCHLHEHQIWVMTNRCALVSVASVV